MRYKVKHLRVFIFTLLDEAILVDNELPYARHYKPRLVFFFTTFSKTISLFLRRFFLENSVLTYGLYSRAANDGARTVFKVKNGHPMYSNQTKIKNPTLKKCY